MKNPIILGVFIIALACFPQEKHIDLTVTETPQPFKIICYNRDDYEQVKTQLALNTLLIKTLDEENQGIRPTHIGEIKALAAKLR